MLGGGTPCFIYSVVPLTGGDLDLPKTDFGEIKTAIIIVSDDAIPWPGHTTKNVKKKSISDDLGLRSPANQKSFQTKKTARTSGS